MALKAETPRTCSIDGCDRPHSARGLCAPHYTQLWNRGELPPKPPRRTKQPCVVDGCNRWRSSHGYCATHWQRIQRHGDATVVLERTYERSGKPTILKNGYLLVYEPEHPLASKSGQVLLHRKVLYEAIGPGPHRCHECGRVVMWGSPRPERLDVDHLDGDRQNNDPANLAPSCHRCNDGQAVRRRTHCGNGHEWTPDNTYIDPRGYRRCRACMRDYERRRVRAGRRSPQP